MRRPWVTPWDAAWTLVAVLLIVVLASNVHVQRPTQPGPAPATRIGRPYTATSVWNTPIAPDPAIDALSAELVASIRLGPTGGEITSDPSQYSFPIYEVDRTTPRTDIPCLHYSCTIVTSGGAERVRILPDVPVPVGARPSSGSDSSLVVVDTETGAEYDLWGFDRAADGTVSVANGSSYNIHWDGTPPAYGSRGAGVPYLAGLIRHWEIASDRLEHAVAFAYPNVAQNGCVWPASKTDGGSTLRNALPEGARLQLDPRLTETDFTAMGLSRAGRIIARALQRYGMILVDGSGRPKILVEDLQANPYASGTWSDPRTEVTEDTIAAIPPESFRVLALPEDWRDGTSMSRHGDCAR